MATLNVKGFPDGLYRKLKARAKRNRRSVAQEVTLILADAVDASKQLSTRDLGGLVPDGPSSAETPAEVRPQPAPRAPMTPE